ncbi:hypothetical protein O6H91_03G086600 [Diphasiastrum complanatum]|uniref:Uncharacterized protein n=1 Tax=Diphasiastrum complanatum TaxID=34168 RepID=A0ACC2E904_DIPCM|nr:hypothetical protein O6H91_03G086600 [Diphasiastrum complanatum]
MHTRCFVSFLLYSGACTYRRANFNYCSKLPSLLQRLKILAMSCRKLLFYCGATSRTCIHNDNMKESTYISSKCIQTTTNVASPVHISGSVGEREREREREKSRLIPKSSWKSVLMTNFEIDKQLDQRLLD